jgi:hypothetical protein
VYGVQSSHESGSCGRTKGLNVMAVQNDAIVSQSINVGSWNLVWAVETDVIPTLKFKHILTHNYQSLLTYLTFIKINTIFMKIMSREIRLIYLNRCNATYRTPNLKAMAPVLNLFAYRQVPSSLCLTKHHAMKTYWGWRYSSTHSWPRH